MIEFLAGGVCCLGAGLAAEAVVVEEGLAVAGLAAGVVAVAGVAGVSLGLEGFLVELESV